MDFKDVQAIVFLALVSLTLLWCVYSYTCGKGQHDTSDGNLNLLGDLTGTSAEKGMSTVCVPPLEKLNHDKPPRTSLDCAVDASDR
jgi:hypothetical protein